MPGAIFYTAKAEDCFSAIPKEFEPLMEIATAKAGALTTRENISVIVLEASDGTYLHAAVPFQDAQAEDDLLNALSARGAVATRLVCIWCEDNMFDMPSHHFRFLLSALNPKNLDAKMLLHGQRCYVVKPISCLRV